MIKFNQLRNAFAWATGRRRHSTARELGLVSAALVIAACFTAQSVAAATGGINVTAKIEEMFKPNPVLVNNAAVSTFDSQFSPPPGVPEGDLTVAHAWTVTQVQYKAHKADSFGPPPGNSYTAIFLNQSSADTSLDFTPHDGGYWQVSVKCTVMVTDTKTNQAWTNAPGTGGTGAQSLTAPSVSSITVARGVDYDYVAYGFSFNDHVTVKGNALGALEITQLIETTTNWKNWNGTNMTTAQIENELGPPIIVDTGGKYVTDSGWNWQALGNITMGTSTQSDSQVENVTNRPVTIGNTGYTEVRRASTTRSFKIEVRIKGTSTIIATHDWGYGWNNSNADWTNQDNPPPPNGDTCAGGPTAGTGAFTNITGITGLP